MPESGQTIRARYEKLSTDRQPFLDRARMAAKYTIPHLLPEEGHRGTSNLPVPFQGLGARAVNNLAAKLLLVMMPPNTNVFRLDVEDERVWQLLGRNQEAITQVKNSLAKMERQTMKSLERHAARVALFEVLQHILVAGNVALYQTTKGTFRVYHLDKFIVRRDGMGTVMEAITHDVTSLTTLPEQIQEQVKAELKEDESDEDLDLYTHIVRESDNRWTVSQEVKGIPIDTGDRASFNSKELPWAFPRATAVDGEDYGRGFVEDHLGDLTSLEGLTQSIVEGSAAAARVLYLVDPAGMTRVDDLRNTENLGFASGRQEDVAALQLDKFADFRVAQVTAGEITERISRAFLLFQSVQRDAERVTAEEVRVVANELEESLGGLYSVLASELQAPFLRAHMGWMRRQQKLPKVPEGLEPVVVTGLEALGRGHELSRLRTFLEFLAPLGEETLRTYLKVNGFIAKVARALNLESEEVVRNEREVQAIQQQQRRREALMQMVTAQSRNMNQQENTPNGR